MPFMTGFQMAQLCYLATNLGYLICQYVQCSCYFEELEGRSGLLSVCLHSTRFWRVKARQGWSVLIEEVGCFDRNTSILCDVPWKRFCCSTVLPFYFPFALKLWNFVVKNAILVKETHTVCGCCRCRDSLVESQAFFLSSLIRHWLPYFFWYWHCKFHWF